MSVASSASVEQMAHMSSDQTSVISVEMHEKQSRLKNTGISSKIKLKTNKEISKMNVEAKKNFLAATCSSRSDLISSSVRSSVR